MSVTRLARSQPRVTLLEQIAEIEAELQVRARVYPMYREMGLLDEVRAAGKLRALQAVLTTLRGLG